MNSADHRCVAALNELETKEQTGHSCAPEVAGALNVGLEGQRKDTAGASHLSAAPQPVQAAEDERAALPFEEVLKHAYYYDEKGEWRGPDADEWTRWHAVARAALASKPAQGGEQSKTEARMQRTISRLQNQIKDLKSSRDYWQKQAALAAQPVREPMGWQPIETAPKDGRKFLLTYKNSTGLPRIVVGGWVTDEEAAETDEDGVGLEAGWYERIDNWGDYYQVSITEGEPTHWMPLPAAPGITKE